MEVQIPRGKGQFLGKGAYCKVQGNFAVTCAKAAEPIEMPFGLWAQSGSRNHELDGVQIPTRRGNFGEKGRPL